MLLKKFFMIAVVIAVTVLPITGHADTEEGFDIEAAVIYETNGESGHLVPHLKNDPSTGIDVLTKWRRFSFGVKSVQYFSFGAFLGLGNLGHTDLFVDWERQFNLFDSNFRYHYVAIQSKFDLWTSDNRHEFMVKFKRKEKRNDWDPYLSTGVVFSSPMEDNLTAVAVIGTTKNFSKKSTDFIADIFFATAIGSHDERFFGKLGISILQEPFNIPLLGKFPFWSKVGSTLFKGTESGLVSQVYFRISL